MKNKKNILTGLALLFLGLFLGWLIKPANNQDNDSSAHEHIESSEDQIWTCSMHPEIRRNEPGDCPICGMDLIPADEAEDDVENPNTYVMSENAMKLANVRTMRVGQKEAEREVRLNGRVEVDERNAYSQSTHIPGRIEQLKVNFTGERVSRGETLAVVYSPELVTAQEELLQANQIKNEQPEIFEAAIEKLRNWRIGENQINEIINSGRALQNFPVTADVSGVVTKRLADLGDYIERGTPIYEIADLSEVWVLFDLYESQLGWIQEGNEVEYTIRSLPGETFEGEITFIDPLLDAQTRVATARVEVDNSDGRFKPGMFASGTVEAGIGEAGSNEIVIPKSAVLWTGRRSVVYIKEDFDQRSGFTLREVMLGPSLGDAYVIEEGLREGEEIVVNGTFTVDAAVQLAGKRSMMSPTGEDTGAGHQHDEIELEREHPDPQNLEISEDAKTDLQAVLHSYLEMKNALVNDDPETAEGQLKVLQESLEEVEASDLEGPAADALEIYRRELEKNIANIGSAGNISGLRDGFDEISEVIIRMMKTFNPIDETLYVQHCPMADNDRGANWLSLSEEIRNPYYGSAMLTCGEVTGVIED